MNYKTFRKFREIASARCISKIASILCDSIAPTVEVDGIKFFCPGYIPYWRATTLFTKEPMLFKYLSVLNRDCVLWDVGANVGQESLYAAKLGAMVYAFEPNPSNYFLLSKNVVLNGLQDRIVCFPFALSEDRDKKFVRSNTNCEYGDADIVGFSSDGLQLPIMTSQCVIQEYNIAPPTHLKIDTDGSEIAILRSIFSGGAGKNVVFASVEFNDNFGIDTIMDANGFQCIYKDKENKYFIKSNAI